MKVRLTTHDDWRNYLRGMMVEGRPGDLHPRIEHAVNLTDLTVQTLAGAMLTWADTDSIYVGSNVGRLGNTIWFTVNTRPYCLIYSGGAVELRERNRDGRTLATFTNQNQTDIPAAFRALACPARLLEAAE
jgi:hypothetical protein